MAEESKVTLVTSLNEQEAALLKRAGKAAEQSYSPYSSIAVGAALLTSSGDIFTGTNVENSSYGLTLCAERSAVAAAVAGGERRFSVLAIASQHVDSIVPCGACLQTLAEFSSGLRILMKSRSGDVYESQLSKLLPKRFSLKNDNTQR